ncbi:integrase, catalytic region, zinc finger, CCHC-type containing protein [Tanacetum coccineum]
MSSNFDDIQAAGSDTRPPMLDRTDTNHGSFQLGVTRDTLGTTPEGGVLLGPERARTYDDLNDNEKKQFDADVHATNIVLQGLPKDIYKLINHNIEAKAIWENVKMLLAGSELTKEDRESQLYNEFERFKMLPGENINEYYSQSLQYQSSTTLSQSQNVQSLTYPQFAEPSSLDTRSDRGSECSTTTESESEVLCSGKWCSSILHGTALSRSVYRCNGIGHIARNCTQPKRPQNSDYFKDKMLLMQAQENGAVLDEEELLFLAGEQVNTFDADVDNQPVQDLALNEDNIFQADKCDAFDSDVDDEPTAQSIFMANLSSAGQAYVIDPTLSYGKSNVISYEQYLSSDNISVVPSCASSALNDVCVSSDNDAFVPHDPIATELKIYKEQLPVIAIV